MRRCTGVPSITRRAKTRPGSYSDTSTSEGSSLPPGARWTSRRRTPTPIGPSPSGTDGDGVGLPLGEPVRIGDVGEDLGWGAVEVGLEREVDHVGCLRTRVHQAAKASWRQREPVSSPAKTRARNGPANRSSAATAAMSVRMSPRGLPALDQREPDGAPGEQDAAAERGDELRVAALLGHQAADQPEVGGAVGGEAALHRLPELRARVAEVGHLERPAAGRRRRPRRARPCRRSAGRSRACRRRLGPRHPPRSSRRTPARRAARASPPRSRG